MGTNPPWPGLRGVDGVCGRDESLVWVVNEADEVDDGAEGWLLLLLLDAPDVFRVLRRAIAVGRVDPRKVGGSGGRGVQE